MAQHAPLGHDRRDIVKREHRVNARHCERVLDVDITDRGVRMRTAHECRLPRPGERDVVDEAAFADQQRPIFETRMAGADHGLLSTVVPAEWSMI